MIRPAENTNTKKGHGSKKNLSISNMNEEKTPQRRKRIMNKSTVNEFRGNKQFSKSKEELDISVNNLEQISKTPKKTSLSPMNLSTSKVKTTLSPVLNHLKKSLAKKRRKCTSSKNLSEMKEDILNLSQKKENYESLIFKVIHSFENQFTIDQLKEKISTNKKKNTAAFFNSQSLKNQSEQCINKIQVIRQKENRHSALKRRLAAEIQALKSDITIIQSDTEGIREKIKEEEDYITKFREIEAEVKEELSNQQVKKNELKKKLARQKRTLEITKEREFLLLEKLQKVFQIISNPD